MESSLPGKTALVTGAGKRLGREIALALGGAGVNVVVHFRKSRQEARELSLDLEKTGVRSWMVQADFEKPEEYETLIDRAVKAAGPLDILVNSASIFPRATLDKMTLEDLNLNVMVNTWVPFHLSRSFARQTRGGKIVNFLDTRITGADPAHAAYILSKQLLNSLTRLMALEMAPNVTVNAIAPGLILPPEGRDESYLDGLKHTVPLQRTGSPADITRAVLFLLESGFITGQVIYVDGGRHLKGASDG